MHTDKQDEYIMRTPTIMYNPEKNDTKAAVIRYGTVRIFVLCYILTKYFFFYFSSSFLCKLPLLFVSFNSTVGLYCSAYKDFLYNSRRCTTYNVYLDIYLQSNIILKSSFIVSRQSVLGSIKPVYYLCTGLYSTYGYTSVCIY